MSSSQATRTANVQQLVESLGKTVKSSSKPRYERIRQNAVAAARATTHSRTNQFAVRDQLAGLEEKAEVYGRSDLAAALSDAVGKANAIENKWMPELLSLLLQISDRPLEKTDLRDLAAEIDLKTEKPLTWEEILKDDPYDNEDGVWDCIDYTVESSLDGDGISVGTGESDSVSASDPRDDKHALSQDIDPREPASLLESVEDWRETVGSHWTTNNHELLMAESQLLREVLFMLHGNPTDFFTLAESRWSPLGGLKIESLSEEVLYSILNQCALLGTHLNRLRDWSLKRAVEPVEQTFLFTLTKAIRSFDSSLLVFEHRTLNNAEEPHTLLRLMPEIRNAFQSLAVFVRVHKDLEAQSSSQFMYLDLLYREACHQQSVGSRAVFNDTIHAFEECLHTFLKPVAAWLFDGVLPEEGISFLASTSSKNPNLATFWSDHYTTVLDASGRPAAPELLQPFVAKIIGIGKTIDFSRMLGEPVPSTNDYSLPNITASVRDYSTMTPFEFILDSMLHQWITSSQKRLEHSLSSVFRSKSGLSDALIALEHVYLSRNGACFDQVAARLLERWSDETQTLASPHMLTAIYQDAWSMSDGVNPDLISVRRRRTPGREVPDAGIMSEIASFDVFYTLPWPVANIVEAEALTKYRRIQTRLLQLRVAKHAMDKTFGCDFGRYDVYRRQLQTLLLSLQHRLRWFINTISSYLLGVVLPVAHEQLRQVAFSASDLTELISFHTETMKTTEKRCLLGERDSPDQKALAAILNLSMNFASTAKHIVEDGSGTEADRALPRESTLGTLSETYDKLLRILYVGVLENSRTEGDRHLQILAQELSFGTSFADG